jgi:hypothetical protein
MSVSKEKETKTSLEREIEQFLKERGAIKVGFANKETLAGPPNADITYILPEAKSAISYALLFDKAIIRDYLSKKNFPNHEGNRFDLNYRSVKISNELASWLSEKGFESKRIISNNNYKKEVKNWKAPGINIRLTCGFCQNICWGDPKETAENYRILTESGCIIQNVDGSIVVLPPKEAEQHFESLPKKHQKKYCIGK